MNFPTSQLCRHTAWFKLFATMFVVGVAERLLHDASAKEPFVRVAPVSVVVERPGITGAGWPVVQRVVSSGAAQQKISLIYPNHPDDWGKSAGTGRSISLDGGATWKAEPDNSPLTGMVDMWQDRLKSGEVVTFGIRSVPDREKALATPVTEEPTEPRSAEKSDNVIATSIDGGQSWSSSAANIFFPKMNGVIARPLPHILESSDGMTWFLPAYAWSKSGNSAVLLTSNDRGRRWLVASTITTDAAIRAAELVVSTPWRETSVERTADGSLLAVLRTGSSAQSTLVSVRSTDEGKSWSAVEKLTAGSPPRPIAGKLPSVRRLDNGMLVLLTAHTKNHCRLYFSLDGTGKQWSTGCIITSHSGGNASLADLGGGKLIVFTPANGRIHAWRTSVTVQEAPATENVPAPRNAKVLDSMKGQIAWSAAEDISRPTKLSHYLVTPILLKPAAENIGTEILPYASIQTSNTTPQIELSRVLLFGGTYRIEIAAVDRDGQRSESISTQEFMFGTKTSQ